MIRTVPEEAGFALLIVLWTVVLLTLLVTHIEMAGRNEAQLALNLRRAAALRAEADGAIALGAFHLLEASAGHWAADGRPHVLRVRNGGVTKRIVVRIADQAGKINLNSAPVPLLQALMAAAGIGPAIASNIAANIAGWRFPSGAGLVAARYKAAGRDYGPPDAPFESLSELRLVLGITPLIFRLLRPHLTLFHPGNPNLADADPLVREALIATGDAVRRVTPRKPGGLRVVAITATAVGAGGTTFTRRAIVRVGPQKGGWLRILTWTAPRA